MASSVPTLAPDIVYMVVEQLISELQLPDGRTHVARGLSLRMDTEFEVSILTSTKRCSC
jgi:hypothetical protein